MECMEARALKSSFCKEIAMKTTNPQIVMEDNYWCVTTSLPSEDFSIDEFFDLPNEENNNININNVFEEEEEEKDSCSFSISSQEHNYSFEENNSNSNFAHFETDLAIPDDDVQELELWSHLMDDSISEPTLACPNPIIDPYKRQKIGFNYLNRVDPVYRPGFFRVPVKPRTKRTRKTLNRSWISGSTESPSCSSSSSSPVSTLFFPYPFYEMGRVKPAMKIKKRKPSISSSLGGENPTVQRRCSHCQVTKTPQWRAGPNGPKTLCNACGVRFKSGRLFPEYRPACSPTFSSEIHSNSHRKVLEMRKKKEGNETICGSPLTVLSS